MKILIGTPIHQIKDYAMERWLENVAKLQAGSPADLLLVDNSPNLNYMKKVKGYLAKYGIKNYAVMHFDYNQGMSVDRRTDRIEQAEEIISQEVISSSYDAWFSWECDQIIPDNSLEILINLMNASGTMIVTHNSWFRDQKNIPLADFGVALISRECLEKYSPLLRFVSGPDFPHMSMERKLGDEAWFKKRVLRSGGNYMDVDGAIGPIYHLKK